MKVKDTKKMLNAFSIYAKKLHSINTYRRKIRQPNFPSEISENIARYALIKKYGWSVSWEIDSGDLNRKTEKKILKIEVKGFSSDGPISFGPSENWDYICFVDCRKFMDNKFTVFLSRTSNLNKKWQTLSINQGETFYSQTKKGLRPRTGFKNIKKNIRLINIFSGSINDF
jgi:hypothetical protein